MHRKKGAPPPSPRAPASPKAPSPTERVFGLAAARAVLTVRPQDVLHIAHSREARREVAELLREAAKLRIAYREVSEDELGRIAGSLHHEGVCMQVRARRLVPLPELARRLREPGFVLALDRVENPHNVGALLRSAGYFGARALVVASARGPVLTPAAVRVAEGAAEHVPVCAVPSLESALTALREAGAQVIGADAHRGSPLGDMRWPTRSVLVLGNEREGLSPRTQALCHDFVCIEGTGAVESLNVSVAAGILLSSLAQAARSTP